LNKKHLKIQLLLYFESPLNQKYSGSGILEWVDGDYHSLIFIKINVLGPESVKAQVMPVSDLFNSYRILRKLEIQNMLDFIRIKVSICQWSLQGT